MATSPTSKKRTTRQRAQAPAPEPKPEPEPGPDSELVDPPGDDQGDDDGHTPQVLVNPEDIPNLCLGEPFALAGVDGQTNAQFLEDNPEAGVPGCFASIMCGCGQAFRADLLTEEARVACPRCDAGYTTLLVVAAVDDPHILAHVNRQVLAANGIKLDDLGDDDDPDDPEPDGDEIPEAVH